MQVVDSTSFDEPIFKIKNKTLMLVEGPIVSCARNIRSVLDDNLMQKYDISLNAFQKSFTMVTDSAAVMDRVEYSSVSTDLHVPDETWMGCMAHFINNVMKHAISSCTNDVNL